MGIKEIAWESAPAREARLGKFGVLLCKYMELPLEIKGNRDPAVGDAAAGPQAVVHAGLEVQRP